MKISKIYLLAVVCFLSTLTSIAQISVTTESDATVLANSLIGSESGITIVDATFTGASTSAGIFSGGDFGISEGILLTSGNAQTAVGPNTSGGAGNSLAEPGDADLDAILPSNSTQDASVLEITFIPDATTVEFTYVFASEEYNEYVCTQYNDVFAFFVNGGTYVNQNIALVPGTSPPMPVSINNVNDGTNGTNFYCGAPQLANSAYYVYNFEGLNIEYDGYTVPLSAVLNVVPGTEYTIKLAIADVGDGVLDSGVFLQGESFVAVTCDAGEIAFANNDSDTLEYCINNIPSVISLSNTGDGVNDTYKYIVTDSTGLILFVNSSNGIISEGWLPGIYNIYGVSYSGNLVGTDEGGNIANISADGCLDMDGPITIDIDECDEEFDCVELGANIGDSCDDENDMTENDMVNEDCICMGTPIEFDCPNLEANFGDACELADGLIGYLNTDCECVPQADCQNYTYYLADHAAADGISTIYGVTLSGGMAIMDSISTSPIEVHIAFNAQDNLIYAVSKHENSYRTLNPLSGIWGSTVTLDDDYGEITAAVFAPAELGGVNGKLLFGSQNQNAIFSLNVSTNVVSPYDSYAPVTGGDLAFTSDGMLYMSTRSGNGLYEVNPPPTPDVLIGNVPIKVTGLAATDGDDLLLSAQGQTSLNLYNTAGSLVTSYTLDLDGNPYTLRDGDLASGCNTGQLIDVCQNYATFYVNHGPDVDGSDLYKIDFVGGNAELTHITNVDFEAHITYDSENDKVYFVNKNGSEFIGYNLGLSAFDPVATPIAGGGIAGSQITAVAFNNGLIYVGDAGSDVISTLDLSGNPTYYAAAPVFGGDLTWVDGVLYLANRSQNTLYKIEFGTATALGSIPGGVNGMAAGATPGNLVTSSASQNAFVEISATDGSTIASHPAMLDGEPFTFINGDMASGCIDDIVGPARPFQSELQSELTSFPNPTSGSSTVVFVTAETGRTLVEVYDMSGRNVATLFNQEAQQGEEYRLDFNGATLPNGVYIYRMTTQNETIIEKFMIAR